MRALLSLAALSAVVLTPTLASATSQVAPANDWSKGFNHGYRVGILSFACIGMYQKRVSEDYFLYTVKWVRNNDSYKGEHEDVLNHFSPQANQSRAINEVNAYCLNVLKRNNIK